MRSENKVGENIRYQAVARHHREWGSCPKNSTVSDVRDPPAGAQVAGVGKGGPHRVWSAQTHGTHTCVGPLAHNTHT